MADKAGTAVVKLKTLGYIASHFQKTIMKNEELLKNLPNHLLVELMVFYSRQHS